MSRKKGPSKIPTIRGRIAERLQRAEERFDESQEDEMEFPEGPGEITLTGPAERGVVALACLILENLREVGGTRAPKKELESVLRKALATFDRKEVMEIEVEAYEILLWIGNAIDPEWSRELDETPEAEDITPDSDHMELIRWAIADQKDLVLEYYSHGRGELTHRRVTPISLEAETYLHGYCHLRQDDRVFRIQRIAELKPAAEHAPWSTDRSPADDPPKRPKPPPAEPPADMEPGASASSGADPVAESGGDGSQQTADPKASHGTDDGTDDDDSQMSLDNSSSSDDEPKTQREAELEKLRAAGGAEPGEHADGGDTGESDNQTERRRPDDGQLSLLGEE